MIEFGWFLTHSKWQLPWKINCDSFTDDDWASIAKILNWKFAFSSVYGIPSGGVKLAEACKQYCTEGYPVLIVDDVLTTGASMEAARLKLGGNAIGFVVYNRHIECPSWVWSMFNVNQWAQSRATGLG